LGGLADHRATYRALRALHPEKPILLEEFGQRTTELGEEEAAIDETAVYLELLADGWAGGLKWMLTDTRAGTDSMGLFRMDGSPKPLAAATSAVARYLASPDGGPLSLDLSGGGSGLCYALRAPGALFVGGTCPDPDAGITADRPAQLFVRRTGGGEAEVSATAAARVSLRPAVPLGAGAGGAWTLERDESGEALPLTVVDDAVVFEVQPGQRYRLRR
jgi:hypothetical protein